MENQKKEKETPESTSDDFMPDDSQAKTQQGDPEAEDYLTAVGFSTQQMIF